MINWIETVRGIATIVAAIFATVVAWWNLRLPRLVFSPELAPMHRRIEALEQFNGDTRPGARPGHWWRVNPLGMLWPETDAAFVVSGGGNGGPPAAARQPVVIIATG
jgi:hypothetical protein